MAGGGHFCRLGSQGIQYQSIASAVLQLPSHEHLTFPYPPLLAFLGSQYLGILLSYCKQLPSNYSNFAASHSSHAGDLKLQITRRHTSTSLNRNLTTSIITDNQYGSRRRSQKWAIHNLRAMVSVTPAYTLNGFLFTTECNSLLGSQYCQYSVSKPNQPRGPRGERNMGGE